MSLRVEDRTAHIGVCVTEGLSNACLALRSNGGLIREWRHSISLVETLLANAPLPAGVTEESLSVTLEPEGRQLLQYAPGDVRPAPAPEAATEPPLPEQVASNDELYLTGLHLQQYRHATRNPEPYWREAIRRDPGDARANTALGTWHLRRGEFALAEAHLLTAIARLTRRNSNPYDGEATLSARSYAASSATLRRGLCRILQIHMERCMARARVPRSR